MELAFAAILIGVLIAVIRARVDVNRSPVEVKSNEQWLGVSPSEFFEKHSKH